MSEVYTPTTEEVAFCFEGELDPQDRRKSFDHWLTSVKADEWDAGARYALDREGFNEVIYDRIKANNPHRKET